MKLILCRNDSITSWLLCLILWCRWSHSAIYDPVTGLVYESTWWGGGVRSMPFFVWVEGRPARELRDCGITDLDAARAWLDAQVGKPYDWSALLGLVMHRDAWQDTSSWFCSELTETAISLFGRARFRADASRITPRHQDMLADWTIKHPPPSQNQRSAGP